MNDLQTVKQVLESIIGLCNAMTTANISHHRSTIKLQAEFALGKIEDMGKVRLDIYIDKLVDHLDVEPQIIDSKEKLINSCFSFIKATEIEIKRESDCYQPTET